ncbi:MAG TPA: catalase, partial [Puia sp.]
MPTKKTKAPLTRSSKKSPAPKKTNSISAAKKESQKKPVNDKIAELSRDMENSEGELMTTNQGVKINDDQNSLKAGNRGPSLLEDFILREKITHFDHERIPERVVHARGSAAHGIFKLYKPLK